MWGLNKYCCKTKVIHWLKKISGKLRFWDFLFFFFFYTATKLKTTLQSFPMHPVCIQKKLPYTCLKTWGQTATILTGSNCAGVQHKKDAMRHTRKCKDTCKGKTPHAAQLKPLLVLSWPCCSLELSSYFAASACHCWNTAIKKRYRHL